ncbi:GmrSD restriction endonuclease domain-containing protein [Yeosuana sp.]|uniref:GmrSD restriction endonuclease domain-containing protein n=1 Tax=Yeosuana sp. TaxID=2529388 RepID=UPI00405504F5|tara:strand:+ start:722 stop:2503 length:1782 start_codon:yes stop_codon:yes gene_type:complete
MNFTDRIKPTDKGITTYLDELKNQDYQIPTFQRDVVWEKENVKKLWDSIYKFYPLGSILVWKTDLKLQNHREIGGHKIVNDNFNRTEYQYLLDGQQRTTSLLTSLYGGKIEGREDFDPALYVDITVESSDDTDDESYKKRFLYWDEIDDKNGTFKRNISKKKKFDEGLILKLIDIKEKYNDIQKTVIKHPEIDLNFDHQYIEELGRIKQVLDNYRLSFIELKGIQVSEVCQIFERINQAGKPLDIFDIVVAKTFRPKSASDNGFYLRDLIDGFREINNSRFLQLSDFDYLQILSILIRENIENSGIVNITPRYLNDIKTEQIETIWADSKKAILKTFDFFENTLNLKGPQLIPYRYFYLTISNYFYQNSNPDYDFLKKYFWFNSLHRDDLLSNTTDIKNHITFLNKEKNKEEYQFERFLIDRDTLRKASYSSKGVSSRAILALFATNQPKDWKFTDRNVIAENFFFSTDKPNLHHIFPTDYIAKNPGSNTIDNNSLMNIAYLTQITNLEISNKNPLDYICDYDKKPDFPTAIKSHLIPEQILEWSSLPEMPENALDLFIEQRIDLIIEQLKSKLNGIKFEVIDTRENVMAEKE